MCIRGYDLGEQICSWGKMDYPTLWDAPKWIPRGCCLGEEIYLGINRSYPNLWVPPKWVSRCYCSGGQTRAAAVPSGQSGLGKSTMVNTLFKSKVSRKSSQPGQEERIPKTVQLQSITHGTATTTGSCPTSPRGEQGTGVGGLKLHSQPQNIPHAGSPAFPQCFFSPVTHLCAPQ